MTTSARKKHCTNRAGCRSKEKGGEGSCRRSAIWRDDRGAALVTALLAMLILSAVGIMISVTVAEDVQVAKNHFESVGCLYVCEAGLNYALAKIEANSSWPGLPSPGKNVAAGRFFVYVSDSTAAGVPLPAGQKRLNVNAFLNSTEREIEVIIQ